MVSIPRQEGLGRTASTLIKQTHNLQSKDPLQDTQRSIHQIAAGGPGRAKNSGHGTEGEASHERGHVPEEKGARVY